MSYDWEPEVGFRQSAYARNHSGKRNYGCSFRQSSDRRWRNFSERPVLDNEIELLVTASLTEVRGSGIISFCCGTEGDVLFVAQGRQGVDSGGSAGGRIACQDCGGQENDPGDCQGCRIV